MPKVEKKNFLLFFSENDEAILERELKKAVPDIAFIDGSHWQTTTPPLRNTLKECCSKLVYFWDPRASPNVPYIALDNGGARGATSGVVIQYMRSQFKDRILTSGDMGIGYDKANTEIGRFVSKVWKAVKKMNACTLECFDKQTGETITKGIKDYVVGPGVIELERCGAIMKHCAADVYYRCE